MGIKNMAKKRALMFVVAVAMAFPTAATSIRQIMCMERSPVLDDVHVTSILKRNVANCLDLVSNTVLLDSSVPVSVTFHVPRPVP